MKHYLDLVSMSARVHKKRSRMTKLCIILAVFLVAVIFGMADMYIQSERQAQTRASGNFHLMITDLDQQSAAVIGLRPKVALADFYLQLDDECTMNNRSAVVAGIDESILRELFQMNGVIEGRWPVNKGEVVLSQNARDYLDIKLGDMIELNISDSKSEVFIVSGFIENTGTLLKNDAYGVMMPVASFRNLFSEDLYTEAFLIQLKPYINMSKEIDDIIAQFALSEDQVIINGNLLMLLGQSRSDYIMSLYAVAIVLAALVITAGIFMIGSSLNSHVLQQTEFFGMMRCLGATPSQVMKYVRKEAFNWCRMGIPAGIALGMVVVWLLCAVLRGLSPEYFADMPLFGVSLIGILCAALTGLCTVILAARAPARKAAKVAPLTAMAGNAYLASPVRKAANTRFYKVDTALGIHHACSVRRNLFLISGSFALSIILFLAFSTLVDFMNQALVTLKPWTPDVSIISEDTSCSLDQSLIGRLDEDTATKRVFGRMFAYDVAGQSHDQHLNINLISYDQLQFEWAEDMLLDGSLEEVRDEGLTVLIVYDEEHDIQIGDMITLDLNGGVAVTVAGRLSSSPFSRVGHTMTVICSEDTFTRLTGEKDYTIIDIQLSRSADDADVQRIRAVAGKQVVFRDQRISNANANGAYYSFALLVYGFLIIVALITIFSIVNTMNMSVTARIRQYQTMRAVGMGDEQLAKMIIAEAASYALSGSILGCLIGIPLHRGIYVSLITYKWGIPWVVPGGKVVCIVVIVILASILAVRGPAKRIHGTSVADTMSAS